jgi:hypothetical protein
MAIVLDWTKIDSDKRFHHLVNSWLLSELNYAGYDPGDPTGGADRGWDGRYQGELRLAPELPPGVWMCQAKFTKLQYKKAKEWLIGELKGREYRGEKQIGEVEKAVSAGADYLLLITSAPLQPDDASEISAIETPGVLKAIVVLYRAKLDELLQQRPWVCHRFFDTPIQPGLVPESQYFGVGVSPIHMQFLGRGQLLDEIAGSVANTACTIVSGASGVGKTRLVRELVAHAHPDLRDRVLLFYNGLRPAIDVIQNELAPKTKYLIVVDDADRNYEETAKPFVDLVRESRHDVRLILVVGRGATPGMLNRLAGQGVLHVDAYQIPALGNESISALLAHHLPDLAQEHAEALVRAVGGIPLLLGLVIQSIVAGRSPMAFTSDTQIRGYLLERTVERATTAIQRDKFNATELLACVACLTPVGQSGGDISLLLGLMGRLDEDRVHLSAALTELCHAGVLRVVGLTYRFAPDLIGDFVLADRVSGGNAMVFKERVLDPCIAAATDRVVTNLLHASWSPAVGDVIAQTLKRWSADEQSAPTEHRQDRLAAARLLAHVEPGPVMELIETMLLFPVPDENLSENWSREDLWNRAMRGERIYRALSTDDVGPPLEVAGDHPDFVRRALEVVSQMSMLRSGRYDNYRVESLVRHFHSPTTVSLDVIGAALATCGDWLSENNAERAQLAICGAVAVLQSSWRYVGSQRGSVLLGAAAPAPSAHLVELRTSAVALLKKALMHNNPAVRVRASAAVADVGDESASLGSPNSPLRERAAAERCDLYRVFSSLLTVEAHLGVLHAMLKTLLRSWLLQRACCDVAEQVLRRVDWLPELAAYRWAADPAEGFDDLTTLLDTAPRTERWRWWISGWSERQLGGVIANLVSHHAMLVETLEARHPGLDGFVDLLNRLALDDLHPKATPPWLFAYQAVHPDYFDVLSSGQGVDRVPAVFRESVQCVWARQTERAFELFRGACKPELADEDPANLRRLLRVVEIAPDCPREEALARLLMEIASSPATDLRREVAERACYWPGVSAQRSLDILCVALRVGFDDVVAERLQWFLEYGVSDAELDKGCMQSTLLVLAPAVDEEHERSFGKLIASSVDTIEQYAALVREMLAQGVRYSSVAPTLLWRDAPSFLRTADDVARLVQHIAGWQRDGLLAELEAKYFLRAIGRVSAQAASLFVSGLEPAASNLTMANELLDDIPFESCSSAWLHLVSQSHRQLLWSTIAESFITAAGSVHELSYTAGEEPAQLHNRINLLRTLEQQHAGAVATLLRKARERVEEALVRFRAERAGEEDPR